MTRNKPLLHTHTHPQTQTHTSTHHVFTPPAVINAHSEHISQFPRNYPRAANHVLLLHTVLEHFSNGADSWRGRVGGCWKHTWRFALLCDSVGVWVCLSFVICGSDHLRADEEKVSKRFSPQSSQYYVWVLEICENVKTFRRKKDHKNIKIYSAWNTIFFRTTTTITTRLHQHKHTSVASI